MCDRVKANPSTSEIHITFDFAEKVLLLALKRQPGQLHFVTGLKFDLFGAASTNMNKVFLFGLLEGHWPHGKTANEVLPMADLVRQSHCDTTSPFSRLDTLGLHCDNCGGQN